MTETNIEFKIINYDILSVYLYLVIDSDGMRMNGLHRYIPERRTRKKSTAKSLAANINRDWNGWKFRTEGMCWQEKRIMLSIMIKVAILVVIDSTCYSIGGRLYKRCKGAGIGLRASACMAKVLMGMIDKIWTGTQQSWGLLVAIYLR